MIYIAGKPECTAAEMCVAEMAQEIIMHMVETTTCLGHELGSLSSSREDYMKAAYELIRQAKSVIFLPDWKCGKETQIQHMYCKYIGKRIMYYKKTAAGAVLTLPRKKKRRQKNGKV